MTCQTECTQGLDGTPIKFKVVAQYAVIAEQKNNWGEAARLWMQASVVAHCDENIVWSRARNKFCESMHLKVQELPES